MTQALLLNQLKQLENPDSRVVFAATVDTLQDLGRLAGSYQGISTGDDPRFVVRFWELFAVNTPHCLLQDSTDAPQLFGGRTLCLHMEGEHGLEQRNRVEGIGAIRGRLAWQSKGVSVARMRNLYATLYTGEYFKTTNFAVIPKQPDNLAALWCFVSSQEFLESVRQLSQGLAIDNGIAEDISFDLDHWQKVADERYPVGLPEPHSDDLTQWLFKGDIPTSTEPLQVAVSRLLGYRWPDQPEGPLDRHVDEDGIVTIAPLVNQDGIAGRLRALLQAAYESEAPARPKGALELLEPRIWNEAVIPNLLAKAGSSGMSLEEWLRDKFFDLHCKVFQQRPFIWHVWDGRKDGFHAFVNYHKLDRKNLERLTHVYLGEWIERQRAASESGDRTADVRLIAAQELQKKLELIRTGEPPFDIFIRWKSLADQPMGWDPDLNDGVRMNIRPFIEACILRGKVNVNWNKDRGKDPKPNVSGTVERHNDLHFTLAEKRAAREAAG